MFDILGSGLLLRN